MKRYYVFLFVLFFINITSIAQKEKVVLDKYEKTQDNKLLIKYYIVNAKPINVYNIDVHIFIKNVEQKLFSVSGDFRNLNGFSKSGKIYWDVLKDLTEFPRISDIYAEIRITEIIQNNINPQSDIVTNSPEGFVSSNNDKSANDVSKSTYNINKQTKSVDERKEKNSSGYIGLLGFEYDYIDKTYQVDIFKIGIIGFTWVLGTLNSSKDRYDNPIIIPSIGTKLEFKVGGPIFKGMDICLVGTGNLASNSSFAVDKDNKSNNKDIYEKTNFFGGVELSSNFNSPNGSFINFYVKAGVDYKNLSYQYIKSDYSYDNKISTGPIQYFTITFGVKLINTSNDFLSLW